MSCGPALVRRSHLLTRHAVRSRPPIPSTSNQQRPWSFFPNASERRLKRLAEEANRQTHDPEVQAAYLRILGKDRPTEVVRRVESGTYANGENVAKEYIKALVATGRFDSVSFSELLRASVAGNNVTATSRESLQKIIASNTGGSGEQAFSGMRGMPGVAGDASIAGAIGAKQALSGTPTEPLHVTLEEPSTQSQIWRAVRVFGTTFLVLAFLGVMMEERGLMKGVGVNTDMAPTPESGEPTTFDDVKGCDEAKEELEEIVEFLRAPTKFTKLGGKLPKGLLLMGPPGTGKTLLARAIAGEAQCPFFYASGSEFEEMFVGVGAKRVRELFSAAKQNSPCIIFIDEIDAIGGKRNPKDQRFLTMTLNQFLVEMDGFQSTDGIIVIGATNFPESLDKALIRPGRFDRHVVVPNPDIRGRTQILEVHTRKIPLSEDVDLEVIAQGTPGFSGAELANLVNIAALKAAIEDFMSVQMKHLEYAKDKILMGAERKSAVISEQTRRLTAYHEGGHALCCIYTESSLPVHKATIMPRGPALGMVSQLPEKDMLSFSKAQMLARMDVAMGGRAAEELIYGEDNVTSGASSDFEQATNLAEAMVTKFGMSDKLGHVTYDKANESPATRALIESEVRRLLDESYARAKALLRSREAELHRLAEALIKHETLTGEEVMMAAKGELPLDFSAKMASAEVRKRVIPENSKQAAKSSGVIDASSTKEEADVA